VPVLREIRSEDGMKKSRFSEEQIIGVLKQAENGRGVAELAREHGVTETTLYRTLVRSHCGTC